jgi:flavin reductase (DIM6/NTAB) family NADH-FMN oxidoreductase RutF
MDQATHSYEPRHGHRLRHDPFNAIVAPRPIGWISSISAKGAFNLAPYSFFNVLNYHPPLIGFARIGWKDTLANISETSEFYWNLVNEPLAEAMNLTCSPAPADVNEFDIAGLTPIAGTLVKAPRVQESPVNLECRVCQIVQLATSAQSVIDSWFITGEVVAVHIDETLISNGVLSTLAARPILRGGGQADYFNLSASQYFAMHRPNWPLD